VIGSARIALADWRARTRTFAFLLVAGAMLQLTYLLVPDAHAGYLTVSVSGTRGVYDAAWMGAINAVCTVIILAFASFYAIRGAVGRDERCGTDGIVAASPVSNIRFIASKWVSDIAVLLFIALVLLVGSMVMQQVRAEDRRFDAAAYLLPFFIVVVPSCAVIGAAATLFEKLRPLRGHGAASFGSSPRSRRSPCRFRMRRTEASRSSPTYSV